MAPEVYLALKHLHRTCAVLSIVGFALRWAAVLAGQAWVRRRPAKTLPHVVDTLLLLSALALAFAAGFTPANAPWRRTNKAQKAANPCFTCLLVFCVFIVIILLFVLFVLNRPVTKEKPTRRCPAGGLAS